MAITDNIITVVIPCYKARQTILQVLEEIPDFIDEIICVDDFCPEQTGKYIEENVTDNRVRIIYHNINQGVGGAMVTGYKAALDTDTDIVIKMDADGQMHPSLIPRFLGPILEHRADYTKGNRFYTLENLEQMPKLRLLGNAVLSFFSKFSTGYWKIFDPNNGYTAIHIKVLELLPLDKISKRFFFESDMLFRLNIINAVVMDVPMEARYADEKSNLNIIFSVFEFGLKHSLNTYKRIFYNYFLRDFSVASVEFFLGPILILYGFMFGIDKWTISITTGLHATAGQVMNAALPMIVGMQLTLSALNYDINNYPSLPLHSLIKKNKH